MLNGSLLTNAFASKGQTRDQANLQDDNYFANNNPNFGFQPGASGLPDSPVNSAPFSITEPFSQLPGTDLAPALPTSGGFTPIADQGAQVYGTPVVDSLPTMVSTPYPLQLPTTVTTPTPDTSLQKPTTSQVIPLDTDGPTVRLPEIVISTRSSNDDVTALEIGLGVVAISAAIAVAPEIAIAVGAIGIGELALELGATVAGALALTATTSTVTQGAELSGNPDGNVSNVTSSSTAGTNNSTASDQPAQAASYMNDASQVSQPDTPATDPLAGDTGASNSDRPLQTDSSASKATADLTGGTNNISSSGADGTPPPLDGGSGGGSYLSSSSYDPVVLDLAGKGIKISPLSSSNSFYALGATTTPNGMVNGGTGSWTNAATNWTDASGWP